MNRAPSISKVDWETTVHRGAIAQSINNLLTRNLQILCDEVFSVVPQIVSIYLTGSFSRGEGSVIVEGDRIGFLSDYDLLVVSNARLLSLKLAHRRLMDFLLNAELPNSEVMIGHPTAELVLMSRVQIRRTTNMVTPLFRYETRTARLIYGDEALKQMPSMEAAAIPRFNGLRLLFDRIFGSVLPFDAEFVESHPRNERLRHLMFESSKLLLACRDALLILDRIYYPTEREKQAHFLDHSERYLSLVHEIPDFLRFLEQAHRYRLRPSAEGEENAMSLSFIAFRVAPKVLQAFLEKVWGLSIDGWRDLIDNLARINFHPLNYELVMTLSRRSGTRVSFLEQALSRPLKRALIALVLLVLCLREGRIDREILVRGREIVGDQSLPFNARDTDRKLWNALKGYVLAYYISPFPPSGSFNDHLQSAIAQFVSAKRG